MRHDQGLYRFRVGQRVRDRKTGILGTVLQGTIVTGEHYQVTRDDGLTTLLLADELEPAEAEARAAGEEPDNG